MSDSKQVGVPRPHFRTSPGTSSEDRLHLRGGSATEGTSAAPFGATFGSSENPMLDTAIERTSQWLVSRQHADGYWCAELQGDSILESEYILLLAWLGKENSSIARKCAAYLVQEQLPEGGWAMYPGGKLEISGSVKAYFALKITGHDPKAEYMQRAARAIRAAGGADAVNSFTRFYLALLGQISYDHCPAVPPELVLLPDWFPISLSKMSAWSRTIVVPLAIMWSYRPVRRLPDELGIAELMIERPENWKALKCPGLSSESGWFSWERFFQGCDSLIKTLEQKRWRPLRRRALAEASSWMRTRFAHSDGLGAIFPPIVWSIVALKCLGYSDHSAEMIYNHDQLKGLTIEEEHTARLQPCLSPVWDTAITLRSLAAAGMAVDAPEASQAMRWLLSKEVTRQGDWASHCNSPPGGWFFEHHNEFYPDVDDSVMVLIAMQEMATLSGCPLQRRDLDRIGDTSILPRLTDQVSVGFDQSPRWRWMRAAGERALRWVLAMQNRDGGWGAFDKDNDSEFLCRVPFADHNAMIDPSTPDLTGRVLEALALWNITAAQPAVQKAIFYLRKTQQADGSWFGRWGVNYIYGTWQTLVGLAAIGLPTSDPAIQRGANWLLSHQQASGAWGESADTYEDPTLAGKGPATASQTAWAILGLLAAGLGDHPAVERGVNWLVEQQQSDGSWTENEFTGTGFPRVFYLKYHYYPIYFPLLAIAQYRAQKSRRSSASSTSTTTPFPVKNTNSLVRSR